MKPQGILLAAGKSARFGSNKLLYPVIDNTPMILLCAEKLASVLPDSVVVINSELIGLTTQLEQLGLIVVINKQAELGMGSSLSCAVGAGESVNPGSGGWLIMLADMPYLETQTIQQLVNRLEKGASIVAPVCNQKRGHPVGFSQTYKNELLALNKDKGAREILKKYHQVLELLPVNDKGVLLDIDQPGDVL